MTPILRPLLAAVVLLLLAFAQPSRADDTPLCPPSFPGCVISNWGQVEPDSIDSAAVHGRSQIAGAAGAHVAVFVESTAAGAGARSTAAGPASAVRSVVSPTNLFPRETDALVAALTRARFHNDGSIAKGGDAIAAAAGEVARKAGAKYALTLYIKAPKGLRPEQSTALYKKVEAINGVITSPGAQKPRS